jgi:hypothetical protein
MTEQIQGHVGLAQLDGNAINLGAGNASTGTQRVVLATDQAAVAISHGAAATGGYTPGQILSAASNNATAIKAGAGTLGFLICFNLNAAAMYVKFYNKATAPDPASDTPVLTVLVPGGTAGAGVCVPLPPQGLAFSTGIGIAMVTGIANNNNTGVAASEVIAAYGYK